MQSTAEPQNLRADLIAAFEECTGRTIGDGITAEPDGSYRWILTDDMTFVLRPSAEPPQLRLEFGARDRDYVETYHSVWDMRRPRPMLSPTADPNRSRLSEITTNASGRHEFWLEFDLEPASAIKELGDWIALAGEDAFAV